MTEREIRRLGPGSLHRRVVVEPGMCGPHGLFAGRVGDWTWQTVAALCGTDVFRARGPDGAPAYLAFYDLHLRAGPALHPGSLGFGDRLEVVSTLFDFGSESILTVHRISEAPAGAAEDGDGPRPVDPEELHGRPREGCLYVESFNRWVSRSREGSNRELVRASPPDFRHRHLPTLPERYSPRHAFHRAREEGSFHPPPPDAATDELTFDYPIDVTRDVNGVGLVYFAAYFSIVERAVFELWRRLGRSPRAFLERIVVDHRICYLGNADVDAVLTLRTRRWTAPGDPAREHFDVTVEDRDSHRRLAVATVQILTEHPR